MIPIHELLSRIRWDPDFGDATFELGVYDRVTHHVHRYPFTAVRFPQGTQHAFELMDETGQTRTIPLHRVRAVYRDGECIWQRGEPAEP